MECRRDEEKLLRYYERNYKLNTPQRKRFFEKMLKDKQAHRETMFCGENDEGIIL